MNRKTRAFTLIELLVVIAIIGILSSIVLTNLNTSRQKARDVARISDIRNIQLALTLYADANSGVYPGALSALTSTFMSVVPHPPAGVSGAASDYVYVPLNAGGGTCNSYHLGTALEQGGNSVLTNDVDAVPGANGTTVATSGCGGSTQFSGSDFYGTSALCNSVASGVTEMCYDVTP